MTAFVLAMVATFVAGLLVLAAVAAVAWRGRRSRIAAERDEMEQLLRDTFAARLDDTQPIDVVDGPFSRSDREIHGMTAFEVAQTRARFNELIGHEWPNQT